MRREIFDVRQSVNCHQQILIRSIVLPSTAIIFEYVSPCGMNQHIIFSSHLYYCSILERLVCIRSINKSGRPNILFRFILIFLFGNTFSSITDPFRLGNVYLRFKYKHSTDMAGPCWIFMDFDYTEAKLWQIRPTTSCFPTTWSFLAGSRSSKASHCVEDMHCLHGRVIAWISDQGSTSLYSGQTSLQTKSWIQVMSRMVIYTSHIVFAYV